MIGAPRDEAPREHRDPDDVDFQLRDLVEHLAKGLVDHPDDVQVEIVHAGDGGEFELRVNSDDIGHVIGKQGNTVKSLRRVLGAAASRVDRRMGLEIAD
ncbi:MAG: KH domain-containing protein [bacterium]